jgi:hypothetical protein
MKSASGQLTFIEDFLNIAHQIRSFTNESIMTYFLSTLEEDKTNPYNLWAAINLCRQMHATTETPSD